MFKNKIFNYIIFTSLVLFFTSSLTVKIASADPELPDNVKINTSLDGSSTTIIVDSKPGFTTNVQTNCLNGKCTHSATSTPLTDTDIKKMQDNIKKQQDTMEKLWKMQEDLFDQQQKMFDELMSYSWF
ncbi:MAG: hypothetical protein WCI91_01545 [Candidatus Nomurabacteria bacterium]